MFIKRYDADNSGHCHRIRLAASLMGIELEPTQVSSLNGERTDEIYQAINPLGQIPLIDDGGFVLTDSIAIIHYLAAKYAKGTGWISADENKSMQP